VIYYFLYPLHREFSALNVLRYVPFRVLAATMTAMLLSFGLYPWFIRTSRKPARRRWAARSSSSRS
jgi:phospho-N-acetylmuramoyl-pentapeptide-transferase